MGINIRDGMTWLAGKMRAQSQTTVEYRRGNLTCQLLAELGSKLLRVDDGAGGTRVERTELDLLVNAADLTPGDAGPVLPERGDEVRITVGSTVEVYEVLPPAGEPPFQKWPGGERLRVHCKWVDSEPA
jgi:hypothetical protein